MFNDNHNYVRSTDLVNWTEHTNMNGYSPGPTAYELRETTFVNNLFIRTSRNNASSAEEMDLTLDYQDYCIIFK